MRARLVIALFPMLLLLCASPAPAAGEPARDTRDDVGTVRGPISDFWLKVRSEWSGYLKTDTGPLPDGGGPLRQRTLVNPPPNRVWVSLVYADLGGGRDKPLAHLFDEFITEWKQAEGRNWPYAQIFDRTWDRMSQTGRTQNIIMIGTPASLAPVGPLAESLGFTIAPGRIDIGKRKYRGDNLILVFIAPNPLNHDKYALAITGTNDEALMQAGHLPYGDSDYVLFRGRRILETGRFEKKNGAWGPPQTWQATGSHAGYSIRESAHYTFWYEPDRLPREDLDALVAAKEKGYAGLAALAPPDAAPPRLVYYLYPSVDRKIDETARDEIVHVDLATGEVHTVYSRVARVVEPYLDLMVLLHHAIGPTRAPQLERALAIALAPEFQGQPVEPMVARLAAREPASTVVKALRDQDVIKPADGPPSSRDLMLAGFLKDLVRRHGREKAFQLVGRVSPGRFDDVFRDVYGRDLPHALEEWSASMGEPAAARARNEASKRTAPPAPDAQPGSHLARGLDLMKRREDVEAARELEQALETAPADPAALSSLAHIAFRHGDFDTAQRRARESLAACSPATQAPAPAACYEAEAWTHLTLGRIEALRGRFVAARVELTHPSVTGGPAPVPTLADYWLLTMGESRNQLTVVSHLKREARVSLRNLDWREAEEGLKKALEIDPTDGEAHRLLSEVYHKEHEYWSWQIRYLNEIHPDYNVLGRVYLPREITPFAARVEFLHSIDSFNDLVLKGNLELLKAQSLYAVEIQNLHAEGDRYLIERHDIQEALKIYRRALDLNQDFFLSHFLVGRCYFLLDRYDEARKSFEEVLRRKPSDILVAAWTHTYLGYIALEQDDLPAARAAFQRALSQTDQGKVGNLAREGLGKVETIRLLTPSSANR